MNIGINFQNLPLVSTMEGTLLSLSVPIRALKLPLLIKSSYEKKILPYWI